MLELEVVRFPVESRTDFDRTGIIFRRDCCLDHAKMLVCQTGESLEDQMSLAPTWTAPAQVTRQRGCMQIEAAREREQSPFIEAELFSSQKDIHLQPVRCIGEFSKHNRRVVKDTVQKSGAHFGRKSLFERATRRKITIPDCKNRFLMVLLARVERFFNNFPHKILKRPAHPFLVTEAIVFHYT